MHDRVGRGGQVDVGLGDAADAGAARSTTCTSSCGSLAISSSNASSEPDTSALSTRLSSLSVAALVEDRRQRALDAAAAGLLLELEPVGALAGERAGLAVVLDDAHELAGLGHGVEAEHLDRLGRPGRP